MFTVNNTKREYYRVNFGASFAALVRLDGSPLFAHGVSMADAQLVTQTPNSYDDGLALTSVSDGCWINADRVRYVPYTSHHQMVDFANKVAQQIDAS